VVVGPGRRLAGRVPQECFASRKEVGSWDTLSPDRVLYDHTTSKIVARATWRTLAPEPQIRSPADA
jgi:hypothetical protein